MYSQADIAYTKTVLTIQPWHIPIWSLTKQFGFVFVQTNLTKYLYYYTKQETKEHVTSLFPFNIRKSQRKFTQHCVVYLRGSQLFLMYLKLLLAALSWFKWNKSQGKRRFYSIEQRWKEASFR